MLQTGMKPQHEGFRHCVVPSSTKAILQLPMRSRLVLLERNAMKNRSVMEEHREHIEGVQEARRKAQQLQASTPSELPGTLPGSQGSASRTIAPVPMPEAWMPVTQPVGQQEVTSARASASGGPRHTKVTTPRTPREALPLVYAGETLLQSPGRASKMQEEDLAESSNRTVPQQGILSIRLRHLEVVAQGNAKLLESHRHYLDEHARLKRLEQAAMH
mmetsp:Transcript_19499/g.35365  ORF Transcript_19499/g.35365 Transcript_19499/m.35365 type:complete len:217 (+) Transcript_19499:54-704(+)